MAVLGNLPKLKRGLGLVHGAHFLHDFPMTGRKRGEDENTKI